MHSKRQLQMGENIKRIMSNIFIEQDLSIIADHFITITQAQISIDGSSVKIFVDITNIKNPILSDKNQQENKKSKASTVSQIMDYLTKLTPNLRFKLASQAKLRVAPEIRFLIDNTNEQISKIENLFASNNHSSS